MLSRLAFAAALLIAPMAQAQTPSPPTAHQVVVAKAAADDVILRGGAGEWFENVTDGALPEVRHRPSGMVCTLAGNQHDRVTIYPQQDPSVPKGHDVSCGWFDEASQTEHTLYATRYSPLPDAESLLAGAANAIVNRFPDAKLYEDEIGTARVEGVIEPVVVAYAVQVQGRPVFTTAIVANQGEWSYKMRSSGSLEDAREISVEASVSLVGAILPTLSDAAR